MNRGPEFLSAQVSYGTKLEQIRSVASRGRQQQAAAAVGGDFGGGRGFLAADDVGGHLGRGRGNRGRRLRTLEGVLASTIDAVLTAGSNTTLPRGSNATLARCIDGAAEPPQLHLGA